MSHPFKLNVVALKVNMVKPHMSSQLKNKLKIIFIILGIKMLVMVCVSTSRT